MGYAKLPEAPLLRLREALAPFNIKDGEDEFIRLASDYLERYADAFRPAADYPSLTRAEQQALTDADIKAGSYKASVRSAAAVATYKTAIVLTGLSCRDAAERLGVTDGRIRQRIADGTLLATKAPGRKAHRLPIFQFTADAELPGLPVVLKAFRASVSLAQIVGFFTTPQPDLEDLNGEAMTPVAWLTQGGDPQLVAELAANI